MSVETKSCLLSGHCVFTDSSASEWYLNAFFKVNMIGFIREPLLASMMWFNKSDERRSVRTSSNRGARCPSPHRSSSGFSRL